MKYLSEETTSDFIGISQSMGHSFNLQNRLICRH